MGRLTKKKLRFKMGDNVIMDLIISIQAPLKVQCDSFLHLNLYLGLKS